MHITVAPASPRTAQAAIRVLLADPSGPTVRGVYRDLARVPAEFKAHSRFEAVQGDIEDALSLDFAGSDAVLAVQPPVYDGVDSVQRARVVSENTKAAIRASASVRRLVLLSSMGAQYDHGVGEILTCNAAEGIMRDAAEEVVFVRAAYFMENWAAALETIRESSFFYTTITPLDFKLPHVATRDIGQVCAEELVHPDSDREASPYIFELHGPRSYSSHDVQLAFEGIAGKNIEMRSIEKEGLADFYASLFPQGVAKRYADMNLSFLPGGVLHEDGKPTGEIRHGKTELVEVLRELFIVA